MQSRLSTRRALGSARTYLSLAAVAAAASCSRSEPADPPPPLATGAEQAGDPKDAAAPDAPIDPNAGLRGMMSKAEHEALSAERGLRIQAPGASPGYTLVMPLNSTKVHLVDTLGRVAHTYETHFAPGGWSYLLDDGSLLHAGRQDEGAKFKGGGIGGVIRRIAKDGSVLWRYDFASEERWQHHDLEPLSNGNLLFIAWERKSAEEAIARGRHPEGVGAAGLWPDAVYEVRPTPPEGGEIVWEWHAWDHLVQDVDPAKPNYGAIADHPGRIDVNAAFVPESEVSDEERRARKERARQMAALGYGGGGDDEDEDEEAEDGDAADGDGSKPPPKRKEWDKTGDWMHTNAVDHHPGLDLLVLSSPELCEIFVIDHSTTTAEAKGSTGGRFGKGGDILWRWGNPAVLTAEGEPAKQLYYQHDPNWLAPYGEDAEDLRVLVFNNGGKRADGDYSSVEELVLPFDRERGFLREDGRPFGPAAPAWQYSDRDTFYSAFISGARRMPNGNTLVASGAAGRIFEVTREGEIVWDYLNPHGGDVKPPEHAGKAPPLALYRADRYAPEHPGIVALFGDPAEREKIIHPGETRSGD